MKEGARTFCVQLSADEYERLYLFAGLARRPRSELTREAIKEWMDRYEEDHKEEVERAAKGLSRAAKGRRART